jgi:hypothetical protein
MRMCRKCSKQASADSKICRDCGAILEEVPDQEVPETGIDWAPRSQAGFLSAAEPHEAGVETADQPIVGEVVVGLEEPALPRTEVSAWKCPQCGETVPDTFDVCWKCLTTKGGEKPDQQDAEFLQRIAEASEDAREDEPTDLYAQALGIEREDPQPPQGKCIRCGSAKMMVGVGICDQGEQSNGSLNVVVFGEPSALIFKDRLYGELKADICGDCGHVELRVANPDELYRHYRKATE